MNIIRRFTNRPTATKVIRSELDDVFGFMLSAEGRVTAIKQGSGMYGAAGGFAFGQFGGNGPLFRNSFGFASAYTVSTWIYRCIEVRARAVSRMPWGVVQVGGKEPEFRHPLSVALKRNKQNILRQTVRTQILYGETFIEKARNEYKYIADLYWLNNLGMAVLIGAGHIYGYTYTAMNGGYPKNFDVSQVAFMRTYNPFDDLRGMSPVEVVLDEVAIDKDVARVVRAFYANDTRVGLLFIPKRDLLEGDSQRFMEAFKRDNQGPNKAGKPVLLPSDVTVERAQNPGELDDVQLRESTRRDICGALGVPLAIAGAWDDANYDSVDTQRKSFYQETVEPDCRDVEDFINTEILPAMDDSGRYEFKFDTESVLAKLEDPNDKSDRNTKRFQAGGMSFNEYRRSEGDKEVQGGDDVYCVPSGYTFVKLGQLLSGQVPTQQPTPEQTVQRAIQDNIQKFPPMKVENVESPAEPIATTESKMLPESTDPALDELFAWERKCKNKGTTKAAVSFTAHHIPEPVQVFVRASLIELEKRDEILDRIQPLRTYKTVFNDARAIVTAFKSYTDIQQDFIRVFKNAVNGALADIVSRRSFGVAMRQALKQYGTPAYLDGYGETELDDLGKSSVDMWLAANSEYVSGFADEVYSSGLSPAQIEQRSELWAGNTLGAIYMEGLIRSKSDKRYRWDWDEESDHCASCKKLNGQIHRLSQWYARDLTPKSVKLDCGIGCTCTLTETTETSTGRFL